jgi:pyrimidine operon attenuation protein/uracil phosphoribosyltransferase
MKLKDKEVVMYSGDVDRALERMAEEIARLHDGKFPMMLIGIKRRGVPIAERLAAPVSEKVGQTVPVGTIDLNRYSDELELVSPDVAFAGLDLPVSLDDHDVVLVDDVLYTGSTFHKGRQILWEFGQPTKIWFAALVDRGHRTMSLNGDVVGLHLETRPEEVVHVHLREVDDEDNVVLMEPDD